MLLYRQYHRQLNAYCTALTNNADDAKDLMSSVIEIAFTRFHELREVSKFKYFLFGVASRLVNNERRKMSAKVFVSEETLHQVKDPRESADAVADHFYLHRALQKLSNDMREAVTLFELQGFSIREIAGIQNTNENTVKTRLQRGREKLKELLNPEIKTDQTQIKYGTR
jgi:RNA polymerase sigma-70 factor (ECF subfamily)